MIGAVIRIILAVLSFVCLIFLLFTDLDNTQRLLLAGTILCTAAANWERS